MTIKLLLILTLALALGGCPPNGSNSNAPSSTTSGSPGGFSLSIPLSLSFGNTRLLPPPPAPPPSTLVPCPPGSVDLTSQTLSPPSPGVTATLTLVDEGPTQELAQGENKVSISVPSGTKYSGSIQPLKTSCEAVGPAKPVSATIGLTYRAAIEDDPADPFTCVFRSRADYSAFTLTVTGTPLDSAIQTLVDSKIKEQILKTIDLRAATGMNAFKRNAPLPAGVDPRCNWRELDADGIVRH